MPIVNFQGDKIEFPYNMMDEEIYDVLNGLMAAGTAVVEVGSVIGSASVAEPVAGLTALATGDSDAVEGMKSRMTYKPHTEVGKRAMERLGQDMQALSDAAGLDKMSGYWRDRVVPALQEQAGPIGGSALAAAGLAAITALGEASPGGKAAGASRRFGTGEGGAIKAFHGSPHDFDEFSMDAIGTGEGAQAYGHGLYFADSEDVARSYKQEGPDAFGSQPVVTPDGVELFEVSDIRSELYGEMDKGLPEGRYLDDFHDPSDIDEAVNFFSNEIISGARGSTPPIGLSKELIDRARKASEKFGHPKGRMYQVDIDATPDELLDWDKPLSEQSEAVKQSVDDLMTLRGAESYFPDGESAKVYLNQGISGDTKGENLYRILNKNRGTVDGTSEIKFSGIKGIKYKDGFSRGADGGTSNYVIFDDRLISIAKKYGLAIPAAAALLAEQTDEDTSGMYQEGI